MKVLGALCLLMLLVAVLASALGVVWTRHESRVLFVSLTALQNQRDELNIEYGKLELEQATYAEPRRIDDEARQKLGMVDPRPQDIRLLR
ncbi:cell division protein FtsL [Rhodanobacter denitrificans]|uniref:Cell division protein FtsL n=1 Tax=Rhodanobacter denitrificans TaxID=666685 RepID=I4WVQ0_9GAMM|nr:MULTISPECIES: cell division protein FtsL [Rhodanobacter]AGG90343.1 cell division protein FtsL [Rhodanobacter denitrificans]EIM03542.1 cell division protein [Rhodanobacter denitrificans]UJJ57384.1 cell division protein FtsL [Rhodanobacter denitrificans]UJM85731.1 cell division protein FtsL [Rhodanobacter denitrificans]UJM91243.1 cell division protein FtsL [Rhodanobacter denitrificans]